MLKDWQRDITKRVPPRLSGYDFVRCVPVFIPYRHFGLNILEHKTQTVPLIQRCVMKGIESNIHAIVGLAELFGVEERVMVEIVSQLESEEMVSITADQVDLTGKGRHALESERKDQIVRGRMPNLYIDRITGKISASPPAWRYEKPDWNQVYLEESASFDMNVVKGNIEIFRTLYEEDSLSRVVFGQNTFLATELYRIVGIAYANLFYRRDFCFVYLNQQDHSWAFKFESGETAYEDMLQKQFKEDMPGARRLLNQPKLNTSASDVRYPADMPEELIASLRISGGKDRRMEAGEAAYHKERPLLPREIYDTLLNCGEFKPKAIYLSMPNAEEFLTDAVLSALMASGTRKIIIRTQGQDHSWNRIKERLEKKREAKGPALDLRTGEDSASVQVLIGAACAMQAAYLPYEGPYGRTVYRLCGQISFAAEHIRQLWTEADEAECAKLFAPSSAEPAQTAGKTKNKTKPPDEAP